MKAYICVFLCFMSVSFTQAQEKYQSFIKELTTVYDKKKKTFQRESQQTMQDYLQSNQGNVKNQQERYDFLFIPELLLKKSKKLYKDIDSTNLVQYFDSKSMFYHRTLVSIDSSYVGHIEVRNFKNVEYIFWPKPFVDNFIYERLYKQLVAINPDMVFTVQNVGWFFFIKDNSLFALAGGGRDEDFLVYTIDEYTEDYRRYIFFIFRYTPRLKTILCR